MASSTESKLKSKYQSSSKKIQELYEQFSNMRKQLFTPSKKSKIQGSLQNAMEKVERQSVNFSFDVQIPRGPRGRQIIKNQQTSSLTFQTQTLIKNTLLKNYTACFIQLDKKVDQKVCLMEVRLENLKNLFVQFSQFSNLKKQQSKVAKDFKCRCVQIQQLLKSVQNKYEKKISQMVYNYQNKISLLVKQHQDTSDSSNSKHLSKELKDELQRSEQKVILKQQQITSLKIEHSRLRRSLDQQKVLIAEKEALIQQLSNQIHDKQLKLSQISKLKTQKSQTEQKICSTCPGLRSKVQSLQNSLQQKSKQIHELKQKIKQLNKQIDNKKQDQHKNESKRHKSQWEQSQIFEKQLAVSDYEQETEMVANIKENDKKQKQIDCQPLRHTQYFNSHNRKNSFRYEQKIKQLQSEVQLLYEQNKLLKNKKDKFEQQCKDNESDQERFQLQCQILRDQLKNLNISMRILDDCAVCCLKEKKISQESVEKLSDSIKFKEQFFKKYPRKKQKSLKL